MTKLQIMNSVTRTFHKTSFKLKKHSPEILIVAGIAGTVASAVLACRATVKATAVLEEAKKDIDNIHECIEREDISPEAYSEEDYKKDLTGVYIRTGLKMVKLYAPAIAIGALSITGMVASHHILRKRNLALAAAYATVDKGFKEYRNRVIERFGKDLDKELRYNIKAKEIEEVMVNEDGTETTVKKTVDVMDNMNYSPYSIVFDDGNTGWSKDAEHNKFFLIQQQNYANEKLKARGHLFLNEVYEMLGAPKTRAGQVVGWIYDEECPVGDNFVDFGIFDITKQKARDFVNGYERVIVLDFNVDGDITTMWP